ncbi:MAG TPA: YDG domain-containing protein [Bacteroidales bacterium]|nr:YDG domain-containing protein [Bacteroidales bacterium]
MRFLSENPAIWQKAYVQTANIDAADTKNWNNGKGFYPIGTYYRSFGWYDGQGYTISNLYINRPNAKSPEFVGLFGYVGGRVNNLGLLNCDIIGNDQVGTLAGLTVGNISNCYATGKINGYSKVGGLIGNLGSSNIVENCYTAVEVTSTFIGGGFAGTGFGTIKNCYSRGNVTATKNYAGGFIGDSWATIKNCYSTGTATSPYNAGGFAGYVDKGTITKCFRDGQTSLNTINIGGSSTGTSVDITSTNTSIMKTNTTFTGAGWDFINETTNGTDDIWTIYTGANDSYPCFVWQTPVPKVVTVKPTQIKNIRATCNGIINDLGSPTPTSYGFCWSKTNTLPTVNDSKVNLGAATQTGAFASIITGLTPVSAYYVRAYAQNAFGISYGSAVYFATSSKIQLTVSAPVVTLSKKYDGTTTAAVTAGTLSGVESGDVVKVSATADYEDANAGKDKKIIVTYTLTGANAAEYFEPDNDTIKNGEITKVQLTSTVPVFVSQKVYDGTTQVNITAAGTISGIVSADAGNVSVSESVLFDNSNVGSDKKIIVAYNLSGTSANNYTAPVNKEFTNGQISQIQLTIAEPVIVTGKLYDGTSEAVITSIGKLTGVVAADAADITVSAKATYNDATVGEGKTITVIYTVDGLRKANYIAPANYMVNTGVIEDKIVLASIDPVTAECDGSGIEIKYSVLQGKPTDYQIIFGEKAKAKGFTNIVYTAFPSGSNTLNITVPNDAAGTFDATLQMKSALSTGEVYPFSFTVNLTSDFIIKKFDDVVLCDNGSKEFTAFQWYKDGTAISGATKQFYNDKSGLVGNYQVKVTTRNSESLITCPLSLNVPLAAQSVKAFPNALSPSQEFKVQLSNFSDESLQGAVLTLFNAYGNAICKQVLSSSEVSLSAPAIHGSYIGHVVTMDGKDFTFRVQVNQ